VNPEPTSIVHVVELAEKLRDLAPESLESPFAAVAWSGGADSTALLTIYLDTLRYLYGSPLPEPLLAVHIDHRIRADSHLDAEWCQQVASAMGPDVRLVTLVVPDGSRLRDMPGSLEQLARIRRYTLLGQAARARGRQFVLTAHHANDNLETMLLALCRGAGLTGLAGVRETIPLAALSNKPEDGAVRVVRPLLEVPRAELVGLLRQRGQAWIEDPTNAEIDKRRNFIRHNVIPQLQEVADSDAPLLRTPFVLSGDRRLLEELTADALNRALRPVPPGYARGVCISRHRLLRLSPELLRQVLRMAIRRGGNPHAIDSDALDDLIQQIEAHAGGSRTLQVRGARIDLLPDRVVVIAGDGQIYRDTPEPTPLPVPGRVNWGDYVLRTNLVEITAATAQAWHSALASGQGDAVAERDGASTPDPAAVRVDRYVEVFDADLVGLPLRVRTPEPGELVTRFGGGTRPMARLLIDHKVAKASRLWIPVVEDRQGLLLWVASVTRSAAAPVTPSTRRILTVHMMMLAT